MSSLYEPARRIGRRHRARFDAHRLSCKDLHQLDESRRRARSDQTREVNQHRILNLGCCRFDDGTRPGHSGATDVVARPLPDIAAQPRRLATARNDVRAAGPEMAGKASEPFRGTSYPLLTLPKDYGAKSSTGSEQMASWFSG